MTDHLDDLDADSQGKFEFGQDSFYATHATDSEITIANRGAEIDKNNRLVSLTVIEEPLAKLSGLKRVFEAPRRFCVAMRDWRLLDERLEHFLILKMGFSARFPVSCFW